MKEVAAAGGIVVKNDNGIKVLLIEDCYGFLTWPKGHIEQGETPEVAALREICEETNQSDTRILEKLGEQKYTYLWEDEDIFKTVYIFLVEVLSHNPIIVQEEEIKSAKWMSPEEAIEKIEYDGSKKLLKKGIDLYKGLIDG